MNRDAFGGCHFEEKPMGELTHILNFQYSWNSYRVWSSPEAAYFGLSTQQAAEMGIDAGEGIALYAECLRGLVFSPNGLLKIVYEKPAGRILGVHICGEDAWYVHFAIVVQGVLLSCAYDCCLTLLLSICAATVSLFIMVRNILVHRVLGPVCLHLRDFNDSESQHFSISLLLFTLPIRNGAGKGPTNGG